jgi:hypothetical protein
MQQRKTIRAPLLLESLKIKVSLNGCGKTLIENTKHGELIPFNVVVSLSLKYYFYIKVYAIYGWL